MPSLTSIAPTAGLVRDSGTPRAASRAAAPSQRASSLLGKRFDLDLFEQRVGFGLLLGLVGGALGFGLLLHFVDVKPRGLADRGPQLAALTS